MEPKLEGFERVYVENDWYDGPRAGLADVRGVVHYFQAVPDFFGSDELDDKFLVWPADPVAFAMEREQWAIFVAWYTARYEAGDDQVGEHPAAGGVDARYDELEIQLAAHRQAPDDALRLAAEWRPIQMKHYTAAGPNYLVRWHPDE